MFFIGQIPFNKTATYKGDDEDLDKIEDEELRKFKMKMKQEKIQNQLSRQQREAWLNAFLITQRSQLVET